MPREHSSSNQKTQLIRSLEDSTAWEEPSTLPTETGMLRLGVYKSWGSQRTPKSEFGSSQMSMGWTLISNLYSEALNSSEVEGSLTFAFNK